MIKIAVYFWLVWSISLLLTACGGATGNETQNTAATNQNAAVAANDNARQKPEPPRNAVTPFEKALFSIRVGEFEQVLVFERKDKGTINAADKEFLRANSPNEVGRDVNRWALTEDGRYAVAGTNFKFKPEQIAALQKRFDVKDYSQGDGIEINLSEYAASEKQQSANSNQTKQNLLKR